MRNRRLVAIGRVGHHGGVRAGRSRHTTYINLTRAFALRATHRKWIELVVSGSESGLEIRRRGSRASRSSKIVIGLFVV